MYVPRLAFSVEEGVVKSELIARGATGVRDTRLNEIITLKTTENRQYISSTCFLECKSSSTSKMSQDREPVLQSKHKSLPLSPRSLPQ